MSGLVRVAAFAVGVAALFAAAAAVGYALGPFDRGRTSAEPSHDDETTSGHGGHAATTGAEPSPPAAHGLSLAVSRRSPLTFRILGAEGRALRSFDVLHERPMHLIAVRNDLSAFHHVHPTLHGSTWVVELELDPGPYTLYADFSSEGRRAVASAPLDVPGSWLERPLPPASTVAHAGPYTVALDAGDPHAETPAMLSFRVTSDGEGVTVDPYLGARGHLVVLREGDLAYLHTHAEEDALEFETTFPSAGSYRAFLQLSVGGAVRTAAFTIEVPE
ncbi:MAG TPA: hypothetical protein VFR32_08935 [Gaiellaceae bacterium]|nr:hypothetical protein [Gaiellaceae bacterium]